MDRDGLYALPPDEFTAARNALAKELRAAGDKAEAAEVAKLRRPSVGAHALNRVAREHPDLIGDVLDAGAALRDASDAAAGGDASGLRAATASERAAAQAVAKAAKQHLGPRGDALVPGLLATLRAAVLDDEVAEQLRTGTLSTEHEQAGFGFGQDADVEAVAPRRAKRPGVKGKAKPTAVQDRPEDDAPRDAEEAAREKAERAEARAAERQRKKEHRAADQRALRLEREAERLAKEAAVAEAAAADARLEADGAMAKAEEARRAADDLA